MKAIDIQWHRCVRLHLCVCTSPLGLRWLADTTQPYTLHARVTLDSESSKWILNAAWISWPCLAVDCTSTCLCPCREAKRFWLITSDTAPVGNLAPSNLLSYISVPWTSTCGPAAGSFTSWTLHKWLHPGGTQLSRLSLFFIFLASNNLLYLAQCQPL